MEESDKRIDPDQYFLFKPDTERFKITGKGTWALVFGIMAIIVGVSVYGKQEIDPLLIKVVGILIFVFGFAELINLVRIKYRLETDYYKRKIDGHTKNNS